MDNYIKKRDTDVRMQTVMSDRVVGTELTSDFSLPDYQPEIKRLLRVRVTLSPPDCYVGAGQVELSGEVNYSMLYVGGDGALYAVSQSDEYRFTTPIEMSSEIDVGEGVLCDVDTVADATSGRVLAPRKVSIRCRLRSRVRVLGEGRPETKIQGAPEESLERLCGRVEVGRSFVGVSETVQLGDEILCDAEAGDLRVIDAEGTVFISEATAGSGAVSCRGEVSLRLLTCREGGDALPTVQQRRIPFQESVEVDGAEVNCQATVSGVCKDISVTVEEGRILCDVGVKLTARAQRNETLELIRDIYSTAAEGEVKRREYRTPRALRCINGNVSVGSTMPLSEVGIRSGAELVDLSLIPTVVSVQSENGKTVLTGRARCQAILCEGGEYSTQELELPIRYEFEGSEQILDYDAALGVISCRGRIDGERIGVDAELSVALCLRGETHFSMLCEANFDTPVRQKGAVYTVCYPSREDTLWSVGKQYHRSVNALSRMNALANAPAADSPDSLAGVKYLLV